MEISLVFPEHPDDDIWEKYALGRLDPAHHAAIEEHLLACEPCQNILALTDNYLSSMKAVLAQQAASQQQQRPRILSFQSLKRPAQITSMAAMAVAAAVLSIGPLRHSGGAAAAPASVALESLRAGSVAAWNRAPAKRALDLSIRLADVPPAANYRLEIVNRSGKSVWSGAPLRGQLTLSARIADGPGAGMYWVRLFGDSSELLAEYGLKLE